MSSRGGPVIIMPKPCLKQAAHAQHNQKHAHFPPPSEEAKRYSGMEYDRTPITIVANELALPARGCGRTFDDLDGHRHHIKKLRFPKEQLAHDVALSSYVVVSPEAAKCTNGRLRLAADSSALPPLVHADTSESEEDETVRLSEGEALRYYPKPAKTDTGLITTAEPKRLRKAHPRGSAISRPIHRTITSIAETTSTSNFASCPGTSSCLGGF